MQAALGPDILMSGDLVTDAIKAVNQDEWQQVASASPKRQREFLCGRYHAHRLLEAMGYTDTTIDRDERGCPLWPEKVVGSISHTSDFCIALVANQRRYASVGIDLEESGRMKSSLWSRLFTDSERAALRQIDDPVEQMRRAAVIFSAKEACYKCDYPVDNHTHEFRDIEVRLEENDRSLSLYNSGSSQRTSHYGYYTTGMTHVMTVVYLNT